MQCVQNIKSKIQKHLNSFIINNKVANVCSQNNISKTIFHSTKCATKYLLDYWTLMEEGSVEEAFYLKKKTEEEKGGFDFFF